MAARAVAQSVIVLLLSGERILVCSGFLFIVLRLTDCARATSSNKASESDTDAQKACASALAKSVRRCAHDEH
jgi:hypothetical protein